MAILVLMPVVILLAGALTVVAIARFRPELRSTWLIVFGFALLGSGATLALRWVLPDPLAVEHWQPFTLSPATAVSFALDSVSWPYAMSLTALLLAMVLTASARLQPNQFPWPWAGSLAITSMGLLSILSGSPLALILTWTAIDFVDLVLVLALARSETLSRQAVFAFSVRVAGTFAVVWSLVYSHNLGAPLTFESIHPDVAMFLLIAAGLRLGVLPLNLPYTQEPPIRRGLGTMLRLVAPASSLPLLARLPAEVALSQWAPYLQAFVLLAALYGSAMWLASLDELRGRPYWLVSAAGLAIACVLHNRPVDSMIWGEVLLLSGGVLFLHSNRSKRLLVLPALGLISLSGLPFTPAADGWAGLLSSPFNPLDLLYLLAGALLLAGYVRHALRPPGTPPNPERWVLVAYPLGLFLLPFTHWILAFFGPGLSIGVWWLPLAVIGFAFGVLLVYLRNRERVETLTQGWLGLVAGRVGAGLAAVFRLNWLYRFIWVIYKALQRFVELTTTIMEGEGGVLWALVLLVLLVTLLSGGGLQ